MSVRKLGKALLKYNQFIDEYFPKVAHFNNIYWQIDGGPDDLSFEADLRFLIPKIGSELEIVRERFPLEKTRFHRETRTSGYFEAVAQTLKVIADELQSASWGKLLLLRTREKKQRLSLFPASGSWQYCLHQGNIYKFDRAGYSDEEMVLQIIDLEDRERKKFERLKNQLALAASVESQETRESIPEQVRIAVWRRDAGKCTKCGSREKLEYDHIIPISKSGSNTVRNIELLCEQCNRQKSGNIQ
ncbi:MAG: HNH endonuclease [Candidatus Peregrinibacteria bacterium Greene0416_62]|nr:MAG: HNH endonuclease [Candidatus Peregrinibacteria bacterium Greene0416_62]